LIQIDGSDHRWSEDRGEPCTLLVFIDDATSTLSRRQKTLAVNIPYRGSEGPLHLLIDSTGIKVEGEGEWHARKHGGPKRRVWRKIHLGIDEETLEVRAVEITGSHIGDAPVLPDLLGQIPADERIGSVTADGAYDTRKCHDAIADRGAHAVIPPRKNAKPWKTITAGASRGAKRRPCAQRNTSAARSGDDGADTTAEAASRQRCIV
jgi:transposase